MVGTLPIYLKVTRKGGGYSAYSSSDGVTWTPIPGSIVTLSLPSGLLEGMAVTSDSVGVLSTVIFNTVATG